MMTTNGDGDRNWASLQANLAWGVQWGLIFAAGFAVLSLPGAIIRAVVGTNIWWQKGLSFLFIVAVYLFGGVAGGIIVGLCRGFLRWWWGRRLVGALVGIPFALAIRVLVFGLGSWPLEDIYVWLLAGAAWGMMMSFVPEEDARKMWPPKRQRRRR